MSRGCAGVKWRCLLLPHSLPRVPSVRRRATGTLWPLAQGAGLSRRRCREGPLRVPREPTGFPDASPAPTAKLESERGGRAGGGHSEFPATLPGCGKRAALQEPGHRAGVINRTVPECQSPGGAGIRYVAHGLGKAGDRPGGRQAGTKINHGGPGTKATPAWEESSCLSKRTDQAFVNTRVLANVRILTHTCKVWGRKSSI